MTSDESVMPDLLDQITNPIATVGGDGAYDVAECYGAIYDAGGSPRIPPHRNARKNTKGDIAIEPRNQAIARINELGGGEEGRKAWQKEIGYHKGSLVETAMYRKKTIFGDKLTSRKSENQSAEVFIKCAALNKMTALGMPESYPLAS
ncbi:MAG: transposase [Chlamydiales bacterium]|nr:transposase [Chlamydiales bacterium]